MNEDRRFNTNEGRLRHRDIVDQTVAEWIAKRNKNEGLKALVEAGCNGSATLFHSGHYIRSPLR